MMRYTDVRRLYTKSRMGIQYINPQKSTQRPIYVVDGNKMQSAMPKT